MKNSFYPFFADILKFCPQNLWHFKDEDVPIKCPKELLYDIEFICTRLCEKISSLNFVSSGLQNLDGFWNC